MMTILVFAVLFWTAVGAVLIRLIPHHWKWTGWIAVGPVGWIVLGTARVLLDWHDANMDSKLRREIHDKWIEERRRRR